MLMSVGFFLSPAAGATAPREVHLGQAAIWIDKEKEETGKSGDGHGQSFLHLFTTLPLPYPCAKTRWGESSSCTFTSVPDPLPHAPSLSPPPSTNKNAGTVYPQRLASFRSGSDWLLLPLSNRRPRHHHAVRLTTSPHLAAPLEGNDNPRGNQGQASHALSVVFSPGCSLLPDPPVVPVPHPCPPPPSLPQRVPPCFVFLVVLLLLDNGREGGGVVRLASLLLGLGIFCCCPIGGEGGREEGKE